MDEEIIIEGKRHSSEEGRSILLKMLQEISDSENISSSSDSNPTTENESDALEDEDYQDDALQISDDDSEIESNLSGQYYIAKNGMKWFRDPPTQRQTLKHNIVRDKPGVKCNRPGSVKEAFGTFVTPEMVSTIVRETNREAERVMNDCNISDANTEHKIWKDTNEMEIEAYIGLLLCAGVYRANREELSELWNEEHGRPIFRATMPLKRFKEITKMIRFDNKATRVARQQEDKLAALREIWDTFVQKLSESYVPGFDMTVDEQLVGFRGKCPFRQYMKSKPAKYGVKIWWLCDSDTSFPLNGQIYLGKPTHGTRDQNQGSRVVNELVRKWKNKGRNIVADNFFTSIPLVQQLLKENTTFVGTLRKNKVEIPKEMLPHKCREIHSSVFGFAGNLTMVSYVPKKSSSVILISSMHHSTTVQGTEQKPEIIMHYNSKKGGVDTLDKMVATYSCKRNTRRWPLLLFYNLLDVAGIASLIVWVFYNPEDFGNVKHKRRHFLLQLGRQLVHPYIEKRLQNGKCIQKGVKSGLLALGYKKQTSSEYIPTSNKRKRCHLCPRTKDKKIKSVCNSCGYNVCSSHSENFVKCSSCAAESD